MGEGRLFGTFPKKKFVASCIFARDARKKKKIGGATQLGSSALENYFFSLFTLISTDRNRDVNNKKKTF